MKISFIGYYGANFGDVLMLDTLLEYFKNHYAKIVIFTYGDADFLKIAIAHHIQSFDIEIVDLNAHGIRDFKDRLRGSVSLSWGGGTCFMDQNGTGGIKYMSIARLMGVQVNYLGIGIDSYSKFKTKAYLFLANMISSNIFARDGKSHEVSKKFDFFNRGSNKLIHDIAFKHQNSDKVQTGIENKYVVYSCRDLSGYDQFDNKQINQSLVWLTIKTCRELGVSKVVNLVCDYEVDLETASLAEALFLESNIAVETVLGHEIEAAVAKISGAAYVVTARLHPAVLAHTLSVPYSIFNYSDKNLKFTREVGEIQRIILPEGLSTHRPDFNVPASEGLAGKAEVIEYAFKQLLPAKT
ncbi:hypothetical protein DBR11_20445 [Pedobacter sp. HMWF019]|uniref:polysaccharide pyruvyl transferase family protein n=1 Tax=Pedobacter sp. HMWF019 TaxID=2056856 RepID=UPI000D36F7B1|nr:polysaccharide pyruvyl transferase family protein [Pedobacter sp. HMWF019]PTS95785.1 hypothetical protein DBR11_20445 [Pedobacter sp. HMWF019]